LTAEFRGADLGDARREKRLETFVEAFGAAPDRSLPEIARDSAELEGIYRFLNNDAFSFRDLLEPHFEATAARAAEGGTALVVHDTSDCSFPFDGHLRRGFAPLHEGRQGFRLQASLALAGDGGHRPLGLLGCDVWADGSWGGTSAERWGDFAESAAAVVAGRCRLIHVIDREGGAYELFHRIALSGDGFVIRLTGRRLVELEEDPGAMLRLSEAAARLEAVHEITVPLARRKPTLMRRSHPPREARIARLSFAAATIHLKQSWPRRRPDWLPKSLAINLVSVKEVAPPKGEEPVEWLLATSEPVATVNDVIAVVEIYRARWLIEEFFKSLKTGCALERRQLESMDALLKVLAISSVVAWRALLLRHESRRDPNRDANVALSRIELAVLRATGPLKLAARPTVNEALLAVAALGGHIKGNGPPGWLVLGRGMERLLERVTGFLLARRLRGKRCDR
jgi:hypothetical protein